MKRINIYIFLAATSICNMSSAADAPTRSPLPSEVIRPVSVFDSKSSNARDPFFPRSTRAPYTEQAAPKEANAAVRRPEVKLVLKGILGSLALINNGTFAEGETHSIKVPGGQVRVRCIKINERSVLVNVEDTNEQIELRLQDK